MLVLLSLINKLFRSLLIIGLWEAQTILRSAIRYHLLRRSSLYLLRRNMTMFLILSRNSIVSSGRRYLRGRLLLWSLFNISKNPIFDQTLWFLVNFWLMGTFCHFLFLPLINITQRMSIGFRLQELLIKFLKFSHFSHLSRFLTNNWPIL